MGKSSFFGPETISLHTGYEPDPAFGSRAVPVYQTTSYVFETVDEAAALFNIEKGGHIYSRMTNPTVAVLEQRIAALEGGVGAICTASGMSAIFVTLMTLCSAGDHIVSASQIYGSTATLLKHTLKRFNIDCTFVSINDEKALKDAIQENTKLVFCEAIGNPGLEVSDLPKISKIAHKNNLPLVIDATFATPATSKTSFPMIPPRIFKLLFSLENFVNIFAEEMASLESATAVGPENKSAKSLHLVFSKASFVILFFVILNLIPCSRICFLSSSNCLTVKP